MTSARYSSAWPTASNSRYPTVLRPNCVRGSRSRSKAEDWANGREMRTLLEKTREAQAMRISTDPLADLSRIATADILEATVN